MALVPETKYNQGISHLRTTDGLYQVGWRAQLQTLGFAQIIAFDASALSGEASSGYTYNNPFTKDIMTFPNGITLYLRLWWDTLNNQWKGCVHAKYNGNDISSADATAAGFSGTMSDNLYNEVFFGVSSYRSGYNYTAPWKFVIWTEYPANPVENVTPADALSFNLFAASYYNVISTHTQVFNNLDQLMEYSQKTWSDITEMPYSVGTQRVDPGMMGWRMYNLDQFNTWSKTAGDGMDDDPAGGKYGERTPEDDTSHTGGGGGTYDPTSDPVDFPGLPTGGALTSGMIKGFVIGAGNLALLQNKLWDMSVFDIATQFQKLLNQPLDCLISLHALPVLPSTGATENVKLGSFDTEVTANRINSQYVVVDCGTLKVPEYYASALDYGPFTRCEIFLPFIGFRDLIIDDVNKMTIALKYYVDVLTGSCVAFIKCGISVLYTFTGSCIQHIPVSTENSDRLHNVISAVGAMTPGIITGNAAATAAGAVSGAINTASSKNHVSRTGDLAGSAGILGEFSPYVIFHRPKQSLAANYNKFKGYPSNITYTLSNLSGYTEVEHVHLTGITGATDAELEEIESLLKEGVII